MFSEWKSNRLVLYTRLKLKYNHFTHVFENKVGVQENYTWIKQHVCLLIIYVFCSALMKYRKRYLFVCYVILFLLNSIFHNPA